MKIDSAELRHVALPLIRPWRTAYGEDATVHTVLVALRSGGVVGWGESCPFYAPTYSAESVFSAYETCREFFLPRIVGREFDSAEDLLRSLAMFKGNYFAKAAVETAWWILDGKLRGQPLWRTLGGTQPLARCGQDFGIQDSIDELLALVQGAVTEGYPRIKLKVKAGWDLDVLRAVRAAFPKAVIHVDGNSGYDLRRDHATLKAFDQFDLAMIEQPLGETDLLDHAELQRQIATPICLDESIKSARDLEVALRIGACRVVNVKPGRVGGLHSAVRIHQVARDAGIVAWVGGMLESGIGAALCAALATLPGFTYPADIFPSRRFFVQDLTAREIELDRGHAVVLTEAPGTGFEPVPERLNRATVSRQVFGA